MIFAFIEDGRIAVLESSADATSRFEAIDVENQVVIFFAEDGSPLIPHFTQPNTRWLFGLLVRNGVFELTPASPNQSVGDSFAVALAEAVDVEPNPHFSSVADIRAHVGASQNA